MVSLPTSSSNRDSNDSPNSIYRSNGDPDYVERNPDIKRANVLWDWYMKAQADLRALRIENEALKNDYVEAQGVADSLTNCELQYQIDLRVAAAQNPVLKRSLKFHKTITAVATLFMVFVAALVLCMIK